MTTPARPHVLQTVVLLAIIQLLIVWLLAGCAAPRGFVVGEEVSPPAGCVEARERGHEC